MNKINMKHRPLKRQGFTLVEMMVVVMIIGVIAAMIGPSLFSNIGRSKQGVARGNVAILESSIELFATEYERYPETLDDLVIRPADIDEEKWQPPSIRAKSLIDPWGNPYVYTYPGNEGTYDLLSMGKDGQIGGEGENTDIVNW